MVTKDGLKGLVDKCRLARSAHTCNHNKLAERKLHVHIFKVVATGSLYNDAFAVALASMSR